MRRIQIIVNNGAGTGQAHRVWNETQRLLRGYKIKYVSANGFNRYDVCKFEN